MSYVRTTSKSQSKSSNLSYPTLLQGLRPYELEDQSNKEVKTCFRRFLKTLNDSLNIIKACTMRFIFSLHSLIAISYVYLIKQDEWYFLNVVGVVFLMIELFVTIVKRKGQEPRWFVNLDQPFY